MLKSLLIHQHGGIYIWQTADDQDEFVGALSLGTAQEEDSDVRAVDRFHGLRVAHPLEAHKMDQGITVGRDACCSLVVDQPSVSCSLCTIQSCLAKSQYPSSYVWQSHNILPVMFGKVTIWGCVVTLSNMKGCCALR